MIIRANKEQLKEEVINFDNQIIMFDKELDNIKNNLSKIKEVWIGIDCDMFMDNINSYLNDVDKLSRILKQYKDSIAKSNNVYIENDKNFSDKLSHIIDLKEE